MATYVEPGANKFFLSRTGVCIYVSVRGSAFRVQFASDASSIGGERPGADEALEMARAELQKQQAALGSLFQKVALRQT